MRHEDRAMSYDPALCIETGRLLLRRWGLCAVLCPLALGRRARQLPAGGGERWRAAIGSRRRKGEALRERLAEEGEAVAVLKDSPLILRRRQTQA